MSQNGIWSGTYNRLPMLVDYHLDTAAVSHNNMTQVYRTANTLSRQIEKECPLGPSQSVFFLNMAIVSLVHYWNIPGLVWEGLDPDSV